MSTYQIGDNIRVFRYGNPIETDSVVVEGKTVELSEEVSVRIEAGKAFFSLPLKKEDMVYGLGGNLGGINKRGKIYESYCTDEASHTEDKRSLYAAHNFFIISGDKHKGYFVDFPSRVNHDVGFTHRDQYDVTISGENFDLYIIDGVSPKAIVSEFLKIIGQSYVPPKWGFGYFQSRWGYKTKDEIREVHETFKTHDIPLDGIYLDLDYMEDFKVFSTSENKFSNLKSFTEEMKEEGIRLIPIIDAGVKIESGYDIYEEGIEGDHFCKDKDGNPDIYNRGNLLDEPIRYAHKHDSFMQEYYGIDVGLKSASSAVYGRQVLGFTEKIDGALISIVSQIKDEFGDVLQLVNCYPCSYSRRMAVEHSDIDMLTFFVKGVTKEQNLKIFK